MSQKYISKVVQYILVQLSSLQVSGRWSLATGQKRACDELSRVEARSKQPAARGLIPDTCILKNVDQGSGQGAGRRKSGTYTLVCEHFEPVRNTAMDP
jgi:hypothetical protein